jgi:hypothetical protein
MISACALRFALSSLWRFVALDVVAVCGRRVRLGLDLGRLLGGAEAFGTKVATIFYVVIFGERGNHGGVPGNLADTVQYDLRAPVVKFNGSVNFDAATLQAPYVADIFQSGREDDDRKGTGHLIFAEVEEMDAFIPDSYFEDFARDAFGFTHVLASFVNRNAVGGGE